MKIQQKEQAEAFEEKLHRYEYPSGTEEEYRAVLNEMKSAAVFVVTTKVDVLSDVETAVADPEFQNAPPDVQQALLSHIAKHKLAERVSYIFPDGTGLEISEDRRFLSQAEVTNLLRGKNA